jgi:hypothetical protein
VITFGAPPNSLIRSCFSITVAIMFPRSVVIFGMTQHVQSVNPPVLVIDAGNQPALVAVNVEHDAASHFIGTPKSLSNIGKVLPLGSPCYRVPSSQRTFPFPIPEVRAEPYGRASSRQSDEERTFDAEIPFRSFATKCSATSLISRFRSSRRPSWRGGAK